MKIIRIAFKGGKVKIETSGFGGESCREATAPYEKRLGVKTSDELTDDYHTHHATEEAKRNA